MTKQKSIKRNTKTKTKTTTNEQFYVGRLVGEKMKRDREVDGACSVRVYERE